MNTTFKYSPLTEDDSIRLLLLHPATSRNEDLRGTFRYTTLSQHYGEVIDPYTALSYVWGNPAPADKLFLDGLEVGITANLSAALRDIRDIKKTHTLWVDAVCIDQRNTAERNKQVAMMQTIYTGANNTIIYLGSLNPSARTVIEAVYYYRKGYRAATMDTDALDAINSSTPNVSTVTKAAHEGLLFHPWFRRIWILQELVLSREPWVQFGTSRVRWQDLCRLLVPLLANERHNGSKDGIPNMTDIESMNRIRTDYWAASDYSLLDDFPELVRSGNIVRREKGILDLKDGRDRRKLWRILKLRRGCQALDCQMDCFQNKKAAT
jgi:hypothetical protein